MASKEQPLSFRNPHYFAAGATLFGDEAKGAYQYDGQTYVGRNVHVAGFDTCTACHGTHELELEVRGLHHLPCRRGYSAGHPHVDG